MIKTKLVSSVLSFAILCSAASVNAETVVVGQLTANPSAVIGAGVTSHTVKGNSIAYIEGDLVTTSSDSSAKINLTSGAAQVVVAPNTVMSVVDAEQASFSLTQGAISVKAQSGETVSVSTPIGSYELSSVTAIDAVAVFQDGEFAAISKADSLTVTSQGGSVVTVVDSTNAFVSNGVSAKSVDVQAAGAAGAAAGGATTAATTVGLTVAAVGAGIAGVTAVVSETVSDTDEAAEEAAEAEAAAAAEAASASPAE